MFLRCIAIVLLTCASVHAETIRWEKQVLSKTYFSEGASFGDINGDGDMDIISGPYWYQGPEFRFKRAYYEPKPFKANQYPDNFFAFVHDFNKDGHADILRLGFPGTPAYWYENPGQNDIANDQTKFWKRHLATKQVGNESPEWKDLNGDGVRDIVCIEDGHYGYASPDAKDPYKPWTFHRISDNKAGGKFTHGMGVGDLNGDGRADLLDRRGWWEQPASLKGDPQWKFHAYTFSPPGGAQMHAYDVDGDGDSDVLSSMAAHSWGLSWYENLGASEAGIKFKQHTLMPMNGQPGSSGIKFSQLHAVNLVDIDGDGLKDIVTGKTYRAHHGRDPGAADPAVVYWWKLVRSDKNGTKTATFIPHLIDNNSGIGRQVEVGDINKDKLPDVVVGNAMGTFVHYQIRGEDNTRAKNGPKTFQGLSGEEAAAKMTVPPGFKVDLIAAEPDVKQPIAMAWDERGRLWVAEAYSYPHRLPADQANDRILIFQDKDGDGTFETRKVFADKLNLVSGLEVGFGGVWVGAAPHILFIPDKNRDDKPDGEPQVILDGFGQQDTHETLNSFTWGPDGWLYGCHGVFTHSKVGTPGSDDSQRVPLNAGVWRLHPRTHKFEVFAYGTSNPWGIAFDERGQMFITACVIPHLYHMVQGGRYQRQAGQHFNPYVYDDIKTIAQTLHYVGNIREHAHWGHTNKPPSSTLEAGGGHAHAGAMIYLGGAFPYDFNNRIYMNNIHGARINMDALEGRGSTSTGRYVGDFAIANDIWSQIIAMKYGPDGQVYMIDWYDKNQCHRGDRNLHDRTNGRIFRVKYVGKDGEWNAGGKPVQVDLSKKSDVELVDLLTHKNHWYPRMARKVLQERAMAPSRVGESNVAAANLPARLKTSSLDCEHDTPQRLHMLWAVKSMGLFDEKYALEVLAHEGECCNELRAWAVQFLCESTNATTGVSDAVHKRMVELAKGSYSKIDRLYLAAALQRLPHAQRWAIAEGLLGHSEDAEDHNLPLMIWYGIEPLVGDNKAKAAQLLAKTKIPLVRQYIARRMTGAAAFPTNQVRLNYKVKDAIEGEAMKIVSITRGKAASQKMNPFPKDKWSGVDHIWWINGQPGDKLTLEFNVAKAGKYNVEAVLTKAHDYGIVQLYLNDKKLGKPIDGYNAADVITTGVLELGTHELKAGKQQLIAEITGANPAATKRFMFGLDYLKLIAAK